MSKLLRSELKEIVKECLVEILAEGLMSQEKQTARPRNIKKRNIAENKTKRHLDNITYGKSKQAKSKINTNLTKDPIMNEILADTAISTLQEQVSAERRNPGGSVSLQGDAAAKLVNENTPESLFGEESAGKWASLAFS